MKTKGIIMKTKRLLEKYLLSEKKWSGDVETHWQPPEGLFTKSAEEIARVLHRESENLDQAMSRLMFYINRAGENLSDKRKKELDKAKNELRKAFGREELIKK